MPLCSKPRNVGKSSSNPDFKLIRRPLDRQKLKQLNQAEREKAIIRRANFIWQPSPYAGSVSRGFSRAIDKAEQDGTVMMTMPVFDMPMNFEAAEAMYPYTKDEEATAKQVMEARLKFWPNTSKIISNMGDILQRFRNTRLCQRFTELVEPLMKNTNCSRIVAFGLGTLCPPASANQELCVKWVTEHISLLIMREIWERHHKNSGKKFRIFLQDPQYWEEDVYAAKNFDMEIVNGALGHQTGWIHITDDTLVCDFCTALPFFPFVLEYARPIAFFKDLHFQAETCNDNPFVYYLKQGNRTRAFPGNGMSHKTGAIHLNQWYTSKFLRLEGLDMGHSSDNTPKKDGARGYTYLGGGPVLYQRKQGLQV